MKRLILTICAILCLVPSVSLAESIILRSGQVGLVPPGVPGDTDGFITYLVGSHSVALRGSSFEPNDFFAARTGSLAELIVPTDDAIQTLLIDSVDSGARWINWNHGMNFPPSGTGRPARSVLYAHPFTVGPAAILSASIDFYWAVDDRLGDPNGDPNPIGVYINGTDLSAAFRGGNRFNQTSASSSVIGSMLNPGTTNWLYVYQRDVGAVVSGVIYRADITTVPEPATIVLLGFGSLALLRKKRRA